MAQPAKMKVNIKGIEQVLKGFDVGDARIKAAVSDGLERGAQLVEDTASLIVARRTGRLAMSICHQKADSPFTYLVGPDKKAFYGYFLELGTTKMPAHPFLLPALQMNKRTIKQLVQVEIRRRLGM